MFVFPYFFSSLSLLMLSEAIGLTSGQYQDLHLELVKKQSDKTHWPSGWRPIETMFMNLRLQAGKGEYLYNIPFGTGQRTSVAVKDGE